MRKRLLNEAIALGIGLVVMTACGGGGGGMVTPPPPPATGSLIVNLSNAPAGATVTVLGPSGYSQTISQTTTLNNLTAGKYVIGAAAIAGTAGSNTISVPAITGNPVNVTSNATATASVSYGTLSTAWQSAGPRAIHILNGIPAAGKLDALAVDPTSALVTIPGTQIQIHSLMYVGGGIYNGPPTASGVYKTTDGGQTWTSMSNGLTDPAIGSLWLNPQTPTTLVAASWTQGLYQSTNSGQSWTLTGPYGSSTALLQIGNTLYAGTGQGIYSSSDNGGTWTQLEPTATPVRSLATSGTAIYAGLDDGSVIVQAAPGGAWQKNTPDTSGGVTSESITVNPQNAQNAYSVEMGYYNVPDFFTTSNGGSSWSAVSANALNASVQVTAFDPLSSTIYIGADVYFGKSTDGGNTWQQMAAPNGSNPGAWYDERLIVPDAGGISGDVMVTADQGLYLTTDGGASWESLNGNLTNSIVYAAAVKGNTIITAMQDLGPLVSFDGGQTWDSHPSNNPPGSEGGTAYINPGNPSYAYVYTAWGFQLSTDGGHNYSYSGTLKGDGFPGCAGNSQLIEADPQNPSTVYAVAYDCQQTQAGFAQGVYTSTNYGQTWTKTSWPVTNPEMIAFDPTNNQNIFVGQTDGTLQVSHNGGQTWTAHTIGETQGQTWWPVTLAVNPSAPNVVLVGMSGPPGLGGGVLRSADGGDTFTAANAGLDPGNPQPWPDYIFRLSYDPAGSGAVVAARFSGIYISTDNGANWLSLQGNIVPNTFTSASFDGGFLYATTFGEGVMRLGGPF
ncbi:MAG TPA: hypothetical protein VJR23_10615 [Candidatus Acidoferrales bacterium]|nr:hypothetical protein [Candidatus Acidoferrales bacterium]